MRTSPPFANDTIHVHMYVEGQKEIRVKMILTQIHSQFPWSCNPKLQ